MPDDGRSEWEIHWTRARRRRRRPRKIIIDSVWRRGTTLTNCGNPKRSGWHRTVGKKAASVGETRPCGIYDKLMLYTIGRSTAGRGMEETEKKKRAVSTFDRENFIQILHRLKAMFRTHARKNSRERANVYDLLSYKSCLTYEELIRFICVRQQTVSSCISDTFFDFRVTVFQNVKKNRSSQIVL